MTQHARWGGLSGVDRLSSVQASHSSTHTGSKLGWRRSKDCLVSICPAVEQLDNLKSVSCAEIRTWLRDWLLPEEDSSLILMIIENINMELSLKKKKNHIHECVFIPWLRLFFSCRSVEYEAKQPTAKGAHCSVNKGRGWTNWTSQRKCSMKDGLSIKRGSRVLWCNFSTNEIT